MSTAKSKRHNARRDANEPEIIEGLEANDCKCHRIDEPGDLIVWNRRLEKWIVIEVKVPGGRLTPKQKLYRERNPDIPVPIVETVEEALAACT